MTTKTESIIIVGSLRRYTKSFAKIKQNPIAHINFVTEEILEAATTP